MRYLTPDECVEWCNRHDVKLGSDRLPERYPSNTGEVVPFCLPETPGQLTWLCRFISESLKPRFACLLWVKESGIFPSNENLHLYYRLRQSYNDVRLLNEAPGHFFLDYEDADLASFLQLGIVNGWDMHVFPELAYGGMDARAVICHDEWIALHHRQEWAAKEWREQLQKAQYRFLETPHGPPVQRNISQ